MASTRELTGGTRDVNPQVLSVTMDMSAADTYTEVSIAIPVNRMPGRGGKTMIIEILKVFVQPSMWPTISAAAETSDWRIVQLKTRSSTTDVDFADPTVIVDDFTQRMGAFTAGGTYAFAESPLIRCYDLTDGAGHGILVAVDTLYLGMDTSGYTVAAGSSIKIYYRWKGVSLADYIGIVQSQQ